MLWFGGKHGNNEVWERLEKLERAFKALQTEWDDMYDRMRRIMSSISKRAAVLESKERVQEEEQAAEVQQHEGNLTHGRLLTPQQLVIQQKILRRRAGG